MLPRLPAAEADFVKSQRILYTFVLFSSHVFHILYITSLIFHIFFTNLY